MFLPYPPAPWNKILFGDRVVADVLSSREVPMAEGLLIQYDWWRGLQGETHVTMEGGGDLSHARDGEEGQTSSRSWKRQGSFSLHVPEQAWPCWPFHFKLPASRTKRQWISVLFSLCYFMKAAPGYSSRWELIFIKSLLCVVSSNFLHFWRTCTLYQVCGFGKEAFEFFKK